jgi:hypothetical protein
VTRHGLSQFPPAAPLLRPTLKCASSLVSNAAKLPRVGNPHRQRHQIQRQFGHIASRPVVPTADRDLDTLSRKQKYP